MNNSKLSSSHLQKLQGEMFSDEKNINLFHFLLQVKYYVKFNLVCTSLSFFHTGIEIIEIGHQLKSSYRWLKYIFKVIRVLYIQWSVYIFMVGLDEIDNSNACMLRFSHAMRQ